MITYDINNGNLYIFMSLFYFFNKNDNILHIFSFIENNNMISYLFVYITRLLVLLFQWEYYRVTR